MSMSAAIHRENDVPYQCLFMLRQNGLLDQNHFKQMRCGNAAMLLTCEPPPLVRTFEIWLQLAS